MKIISTVLVILMFAAPGAAIAAGEGDACYGKTINILMETVPDTVAIKKLKTQFENEHGAKVKIEALTYSLMHEKLVSSLVAPVSNYDVLIVDSYWVGEFATAGWMKPLDDYIKRDNIDTNRYFDSLMAINGRVNGTTYMLPYWQYAMGLLYRKDIVSDPSFQSAYKDHFGHEWRIPKTLSELYDVAKWAADYTGKFGMAMAGRRSDPVVMEATNYVFAEGADFYNRKTWEPTVTTPEFEKAVHIYAELLEDTAQPGALSANFDAVANTLKQGKALFAVSYLFLFPKLQDPDSSRVVGKMAFAPVPGGDSFLGAWGWAIPHNAETPDCSWEFIKWVESHDVAYKRAMLGGQPTQKWIYDDSDFIKKWPQMKHVKYVLSHSKGLPVMSRSSALVETFAQVLGKVLVNDTDPAKALAESKDKFGKLVANDPLLQ